MTALILMNKQAFFSANVSQQGRRPKLLRHTIIYHAYQPYIMHCLESVVDEAWDIRYKEAALQRKDYHDMRREANKQTHKCFAPSAARSVNTLPTNESNKSAEVKE